MSQSEDLRVPNIAFIGNYLPLADCEYSCCIRSDGS